MDRHHHVVFPQFDLRERRLQQRHAVAQFRPLRRNGARERRARRRQRLIGEDHLGGRVVEQQHDLAEQPMPGAQIDDAAATETAANATSDFPGFEQLLPWQAAGAAHDPCDPVEQCVAREAAEIVIRETGFRRLGEHVVGQRCGRNAVTLSVSRVWVADRRHSRPSTRAPGRSVPSQDLQPQPSNGLPSAGLHSGNACARRSRSAVV